MPNSNLLEVQESGDESDDSHRKKIDRFSFSKYLQKYPVPLTLLLLGVILAGYGVLLYKNDSLNTSNKIEILETNTGSESDKSNLIVEVSGAVASPGVYEFEKGKRIDDALVAAGGILEEADDDFLEKALNRAAKLVDGQKIFIPAKSDETNVLGTSDDVSYQSGSGDQTRGLVNVNSASANQLEELWGIGRVTAQNIIEQRPYSSVEELLDKKIIKKNVYEKNKDLLSVY